MIEPFQSLNEMCDWAQAAIKDGSHQKKQTDFFACQVSSKKLRLIHDPDFGSVKTYKSELSQLFYPLNESFFPVQTGESFGLRS